MNASCWQVVSVNRRIANDGTYHGGLDERPVVVNGAFAPYDFGTPRFYETFPNCFFSDADEAPNGTLPCPFALSRRDESE